MDSATDGLRSTLWLADHFGIPPAYRRLQFHKTPEYTFALLRNHTLPGPGNADDRPVSENEVADTALRGLGFSNSEN